MAVSDHMRPGLTSKSRVKIMTVNPATRRVEGVLKDGSMIQIAVWDVPSAFRWPQEGEIWIVRRDNGIWILDQRQQQDKNETTKAITSMSPGQMVLDSKSVIDATGRTVIAAPAAGAGIGKVITSDAAGNPTWQPPSSGGPAGGVLAGTYPNPTAAPWLGLNGNSLTGYGAQGFWPPLGVVWDRGNPIALNVGSSTTPLVTNVGTSIGLGMMPYIVIHPTGYTGAGSIPIPTGAGITTYANGFVSIVQTLLAAYPTAKLAFEIMNEPWFFTGATAAQYAACVIATLQACQAAGIPLTNIYAMAQSAAWVSGMYTAQPTLGTLVQGWSAHVYGYPPPAGSGGGVGIASLPLTRAVMTSGANNIIISELGFWTPDVNGGGSGSAQGTASAVNSTQAALWLQETLQLGAAYHSAGWLRALFVYSRNDGGWAMQLAGGNLTAQGIALTQFPQPPAQPLAAGTYNPFDDNYLATTLSDPAIASGVFQPTTGVIYLFRARIDNYAFSGNIVVYVNNAGAGLTVNQCVAGTYDAAGNMWSGPTSDQSTAWTSTGAKFMGGAGANYNPGTYWIALLCVGTTTPQFQAVASAPIINIANFSALPVRAMQTSATFTALPANLSLTSGLTRTPALPFLALTAS